MAQALGARIRVDHGPDVGRRIARVAHHTVARGPLEALQELVVHGLVHHHARGRRALLALEAESGAHHALHGLVHVGGLIDDDGVLAAHLSDDLAALLQSLVHRRHLLSDVQPHILRASEEDGRHVRVGGERLAHDLAPAVQQLHAAGRCASLEQDGVQHLGGGGRLLGGLHDDRVARDERRDGHAAQDGEGEIPRCDDHRNAARPVEERVFLPHELAQRLRLAELHGLASVVLREIDSLGRFGIGVCPALAGVVHDARRHVVPTLAYDRSHAHGDRRTLPRRHGGPRRRRGDRARDGVVGIGRARFSRRGWTILQQLRRAALDGRR
mmetsp:Transcript_3256/g.13192  ORF Transcript_3256/g.13192 Transcript_3256/m.13192 type:complete len:327 (-) Transcript_3256:1581-2561(-)